MQYRILGPLEVVDEHGRPVPGLGPPKQRALLTLLVLHAGSVLPTDRIVEALWSGRPPRTAAHSVQVYVSDLRRGLGGGAAGGDGDTIETRGAGYLLRAEPDQVDARRFERLVADGGRALRAGNPGDAVRDLAEGLSLWRGPALADVAGEEFAQEHIRELNGRRVDALEGLADARLATGDDEDVLPLLVDAIGVDPMRERLRGLLMVALYRAGRHPEALRSFQRFADLLADELGIDPSPELRHLQERILLHDPALSPRRREEPDPATVVRNPYKGLRPFAEDDAEDFFGRANLIERLLDELRLGARLLTLVGPSGSGKSSVVAAGVLPRLRAGAVAGSEAWQLVPLVPDEEAVAVLEDLREAQDVAPATLVVVDQLEELFVHLDSTLAARFLRELTALVTDPGGRVRALTTLRADFYDRPLEHRGFADAFLAGVVTVLPLSAADLEQAVVGPVSRVGSEIEPGLVAELVAEAVDRPGALPLLQYVLTEVFDRCRGSVLSSAAYHEIDGLRGALRRRAEGLFTSLDADRQEVAIQVFLRLVRVGPGERDSRRRVPVSELIGTGLDTVALSDVLEQFARHRLLSLDRDAATAEPTVELAHEALLWEWHRYAGWVETHRAALADRDALLRAVEEWESSGRHPDYLLRGQRLARFTAWSAGARLRLSSREHAMLDASEELDRGESARAEAQRASSQRQRRDRRRLVGLSVAVALLGTAAGAAVATRGDPGPPRAGLLFHDAGTEVDQQCGPASTARCPTSTWRRRSAPRACAALRASSIGCCPPTSTSSSSTRSRPRWTRLPAGTPTSGSSPWTR